MTAQSYRFRSVPLEPKRGGLEEIKQLKEKYRRYRGMMTDYERAMAEQEINKAIAANEQAIIGAALGELESAFNAHERAINAQQRARRAEINSWDSEQMERELRLAQQRVKAAIDQGGGVFGETGPGDKIAAMWDEAKASGDRFKIRALSEALSAVESSRNFAQPDQRQKAVYAARESTSTLESLRVTPDMENAKKARAEAEAQIMQKRADLLDIGQLLYNTDYSGPLSGGLIGLAVNRITQSADGLEILPADSPEVTGVDWSKFHMEE